MDTPTLSLLLSALAMAIALYAAFGKKTAPPAPSATDAGTRALRLQAYERLVLLTERIALPNLISRLNQPGISATEMKLFLTENIKQEFEYNSTQQLYVTQLSWDAVRNLKEQNLMIIHQVAASLPLDASAADLNKKILELILNQPNGALHELVLQALNHEAKKLM
ncbi:MAG: hypothetical protein JNM88_11935 [Chitinophagaceae bacterium]|nr:hypothetical protein [Chitinophagaceae bacterium]